MAGLPELEQALINADKAGDAAAATAIANEIKRQRATVQAQPAFEQRAAGMDHQQMVDTYRSLPKDDPFVGFLARRIAQPQAGENPQQAQDRAYGKLSDAPGQISDTGAAAATFLQGVPFAGEWADETLGWFASAGPNDWQTNTRAIREGQARMDAENPKTATALRVGGGVTAGVTAGLMGAGVPWTMPASLGGRVFAGGLTGLGAGALEGGVSGYGSGTDSESRKSNAGTRALFGGLVGGALGLAAPVVAEGASALYRRGQDYLTLGREARASGMDRSAYEHVIRALEADDAFSPQGRQNIAAGGPEAMLADAGPATTTLLDAAQQNTGPSTGISRRAVEDRAARAGLQATDALDNALGPPRGMETMQEGIRTGTQAARQSTYRAAYAAPINYAAPEGQALEQMLPDIPPDVLRTANRIMQVRREPASAQILMRQMPDGSFQLERLPDVRQWDYITRAMNELADGQEGRGALGGQTAIGDGFQSWSRDIRRTLRGLVPEYGVALDTAGDAIANRQALEFGERLLNPSTSRDEVARMMNGLTAPEQQNMAAGVRSYMDERLANVTRALTDNNMDAREAMKAVKDMSSRAAREKITAFLGPQEADAFFTQFDQAARGIELRANLATNSRTAVRTRAQREIDESVNGGVVNALREGGPVNIYKNTMQNLFGGTNADKIGRSDRVWAQIADALTGPMPQQRLQALTHINNMSPGNAALARYAGGLAGYGAFGPGGYNAAMDLLNPRRREQISNTLEGR